jgi:hypothetical protein
MLQRPVANRYTNVAVSHASRGCMGSVAVLGRGALAYVDNQAANAVTRRSCAHCTLHYATESRTVEGCTRTHMGFGRHSGWRLQRQKWAQYNSTQRITSTGS